MVTGPGCNNFQLIQQLNLAACDMLLTALNEEHTLAAVKQATILFPCGD
jgi:hypothetical protein